jgi:hypothetical protein
VSKESVKVMFCQVNRMTETPRHGMDRGFFRPNLPRASPESARCGAFGSVSRPVTGPRADMAPMTAALGYYSARAQQLTLAELRRGRHVDHPGQRSASG